MRNPLKLRVLYFLLTLKFVTLKLLHNPGQSLYQFAMHLGLDNVKCA